MITQTMVMTRPDISAHWFNDAPEMQAYLAPRNQLRENRPELTDIPVITESSDGLTCTIVQTFPSIDEYNTYVNLLIQAIPGWPKGRNEYVVDHAHTINIHLSGDGVNLVYTPT